MREKIISANNRFNGWLLPLLLLPVWTFLYLNLTNISNFVVDSILGLEKGNHLAETLRFFIFEVPKVMLLLVLIIFFVGIIRTYFTPERTRDMLSGKSLFTGNIMASLLGIVTPFCSCSAIPLFLGFVEAGVPLGITFSFLIAAPLVNEVAVVLLLGLFGWKVTLIYVLTGLTIAVLAGWLIGALKLEKYVAEWVYTVKTGLQKDVNNKIPFSERINMGYTTVKEIIGKMRRNARPGC